MIGKREIASEKLGGTCTKTVDRYVELGVFPPPVKLTGTKFSPCLWYEREIDAIIARQAASSVEVKQKAKAKTKATTATALVPSGTEEPGRAA
jgi:predicted DNA-binding transcriptional regulator AlpA